MKYIFIHLRATVMPKSFLQSSITWVPTISPWSFFVTSLNISSILQITVIMKELYTMILIFNFIIELQNSQQYFTWNMCSNHHWTMAFFWWHPVLETAYDSLSRFQPSYPWWWKEVLCMTLTNGCVIRSYTKKMKLKTIDFSFKT